MIPILKAQPLQVLMEETGLSRRALLDPRARRSRPHPTNLQLIKAVLRKLASS